MPDKRRTMLSLAHTSAFETHRERQDRKKLCGGIILQWKRESESGLQECVMWGERTWCDGIVRQRVLKEKQGRERRWRGKQNKTEILETEEDRGRRMLARSLAFAYGTHVKNVAGKWSDERTGNDGGGRGRRYTQTQLLLLVQYLPRGKKKKSERGKILLLSSSGWCKWIFLFVSVCMFSRHRAGEKKKKYQHPAITWLDEADICACVCRRGRHTPFACDKNEHKEHHDMSKQSNGQ